MVDTFVAVGELALFVGMADRWQARDRVAAWSVTLVGLAVSIAGNIGHIATSDLASRLTAAVPPIAAAASLSVALGVLKRVVASHHAVPATAPAPMTESIPAAPEPAPRIAPVTAEPALPAAPAPSPVTVPVTAVETAPERTAPKPGKRAPSKSKSRAQKRTNGRARAATPEEAERIFADDLASGVIPSQREIKSRARCGNEKSRELRAHLLAMVENQRKAA
jgi:hypothetical protein